MPVPVRMVGAVVGSLLVAAVWGQGVAASEEMRSTASPLVVVPGEAQARESAVPAVPSAPLPPILAWLVRNGVQITALGEIGGMDGYFLVRTLPDNTIQQQVAYLAPSGNHLIVGRMFDAEGNDMTARQLQDMYARMAAILGEGQERTAAGSGGQAGGTSRPLEAAQQAARVAAVAARSPEDVLRSAGWFEVGKADRTLWFIADPSCPFCHQAWRVLGPMVERGEVAVRVVLVANSAQSLVEAAWVLDQAKPGDAWLQGFGRGERFSPEEWQRAWHGALTGARPMNARQSMLASLLEGNGAIASSLGVRGTPWLAYGHNGEWRTMVGMGDIAAFLAPLRGGAASRGR